MIFSKADGNQTVFINGGDADMTLGKNGADGDVMIQDAQGNSSVHLNGASGRVTAKDLALEDSTFARVDMTATTPSNDVKMTVNARGDGTNRGQLGTLSNHPLVFLTNNKARMVIENDGGVCIGNC